MCNKVISDVDLTGLIERLGRKKISYYVDKQGDIVAKKCSECSNINYLDYYRKNKCGLGGVDSKCKRCRGFKGLFSHVEIVKEISNSSVIYKKKCTKCEKLKTLKEFNKGRCAGGKKPECRECERVYREARVSEKKKVDREYYLKHTEKIKQQSDSYRKKNVKKSNQLANIRWHRRLARKLSLPDTLTETQWQSTLLHFGGCALTGCAESINRDHVLPLASNHGGTTYENMVPLRADLNCSKGDRNVFEWFETNRQRFNLSQTKFDAMISYIAELNGMSVDEYRKWYDDCYYESDRANGHDERIVLPS